MKRFLVVFSLLPSALVGCAPAPAEPAAAQEAQPTGIDYTGWPQLTTRAIPVSQEQWRWCRGPQPDDPRVKEAKKLGPHAVPAIRVLANPLAHEHLRQKRRGPLPVGSVIIKEKLMDVGDARAFAYAAMIKKEAGYDPDHGDWEYLYVPLAEPGKAERGKLPTCIDCHRDAVATDYLFRRYDPTRE